MILNVYDKGECVYGVQKFDCQLYQPVKPSWRLLFVLLVVKAFANHKICDYEDGLGVFLLICFHLPWIVVFCLSCMIYMNAFDLFLIQKSILLLVTQIIVLVWNQMILFIKQQMQGRKTHKTLLLNWGFTDKM